MPLIVTPGQLTHRAELYHQLAQLTAAGIPLMSALTQLERHPPSHSFRSHLRGISISLTQGFTLSEALRAENWLPEFDVALIDAGERSGRLDTCFRLLAEYYADRARMARQVIMDLLYPLALLHFAVFVFTFPFATLLTTGVRLVDFLKIAAVLLPFYGLTLALLYAGQSRHGETWRGLIETFLRPFPVLGAARNYLALARLAAALEALIAAGVTIIEAWELASVACGSPGIAREVKTWRRDLLAGETPADKVSNSSWFPELFANLYHTGEVSGSLDDSLIKLRKYYQEEGSRKFHAVAKWVPLFIYFCIMMAIAYKIVSFYMGYFQQLQNVMEP
jgi:type II secretory pathway component PulF